MKICPKCQKTYTDDNLNFCLEDGSVLSQMQAGAMPETVLLNQPRLTQQPQPGQFPQAPVTQASSQAGWQTGQPAYSMQPKKSSKTWIWVLAIVVVLMFTCGGGLLGLIMYAGSQVDTSNANTLSNSTSNVSGNTGKNSNSAGNTPGRNTLVTVDLQKWATDSSTYANLDYSSGELTMSTKQKKYYYVHPGTADQNSTGADVSVIVRNTDNSDTNFGYGLVFHSSPTALKLGYAFLVDSKKKRYRVVHHYPQHEDDVVKWTKSDEILDGTQGNKLEARDRTSTIDLYINGRMVTSVPNTYGYANGVVGLDVADGVKASFKNFEIRK